MQKLAKFLEEHSHLTEAELSSKFNHGFLVVSKTLSEKEESGRDFHTKLADDIKESLTSSYGNTDIHPLVKREAGHTYSRITVGRTRNNDVVLDIEAISKLHAYFKLNRKGNYTVSDAGSTNGTWVDGTRLEKNQPVELRGGESIVFGNALEATFHTPVTLYRHITILKRWLLS
jgi:hypothetical protein